MGASLSFSLVEVHEAPALKLRSGGWSFSCALPGAEPQSDTGKYIEVWVRQPNGSGLIADDIFNSSLPAPGS